MTEPARPFIRRIAITGEAPYGTYGGTSFRRIDGRVHGELSPDEAIPGLARAARNARGCVEYDAPFVLLLPRDTTAGNAALLVDLPNRGRPISQHLYNSPREPFLTVGALEPGSGFLQERGYAVAMLQWELGHGIALPAFKDQDGRTRFVEGAGIAAIRDFAHFLRHAHADAEGTPNPLHGRVDRVLAVGYSQTARVLKSMLVEGLDIARGRRVFDALHLHAGAAGLANIHATGCGPESGTSVTPHFGAPDVRGVAEEPLSWDGIVARAAAHGAAHGLPLPKLLVTNMGTDYLSLRASLARSGAGGTADLPVPANLRLYDIAGASHSRAETSGCELPPGRLDYFPVMRATLVNLDAWLRENSEPPASCLMPLTPATGRADVLQAPAHLPGAIVQAPLTDADGNMRGGVRLPDLAVPLGAHGLQNRPLAEPPCNLVAAFRGFDGDAVRARHATREGYVAAIRAAAARLVEARFLLPADALEIERAAQAAAYW